MESTMSLAGENNKGSDIIKENKKEADTERI